MMPLWLAILITALGGVIGIGLIIVSLCDRKLPVVAKTIITVLLVIGLGALVIFCIATSKEMTFVDYIKSWFEKTADVNTASALFIKR